MLRILIILLLIVGCGDEEDAPSICVLVGLVEWETPGLQVEAWRDIHCYQNVSEAICLHLDEKNSELRYEYYGNAYSCEDKCEEIIEEVMSAAGITSEEVSAYPHPLSYCT